MSEPNKEQASKEIGYAKDHLISAVSALESKKHWFAGTITELKLIIGDLSCGEKLLKETKTGD